MNPIQRTLLATLCLCAGLGGAVRAQGQGEPPPEAPVDAVEGDGGDDAGARVEAPVAEDPEAAARARNHFRMGVDFFRESNFGAALIEFQRAYELVPHYKVLFNLGQTYIELQEYGKAVEALQGYLDRGDDQIPEHRRAQVEALIQQQQSRLATVTIRSDQRGARVFVDERLVGTTPLSQALSVGAGRRHFRVAKEGYVTVERRIDLGAGDTQVLAFELEPTARPTAAAAEVSPTRPAPAAPAVAPVRDDSGLDTGVMVAGVSTLVLGGATATMALLTLAAEADLEAERDRLTTPGRLEELGDDVDRRALLTDIGLGLTAAGAVVTAVLFFTQDDSGERETASPVTLDLGRRGATIYWHGRF